MFDPLAAHDRHGHRQVAYVGGGAHARDDHFADGAGFGFGFRVRGSLCVRRGQRGAGGGEEEEGAFHRSDV